VGAAAQDAFDGGGEVLVRGDGISERLLHEPSNPPGVGDPRPIAELIGDDDRLVGVAASAVDVAHPRQHEATAQRRGHLGELAGRRPDDGDELVRELLRSVQVAGSSLCVDQEREGRDLPSQTCGTSLLV
jgi:hypothetical protein